MLLWKVRCFPPPPASFLPRPAQHARKRKCPPKCQQQPAPTPPIPLFLQLPLTVCSDNHQGPWSPIRRPHQRQVPCPHTTPLPLLFLSLHQQLRCQRELVGEAGAHPTLNQAANVILMMTIARPTPTPMTKTMMICPAPRVFTLIILTLTHPKLLAEEGGPSVPPLPFLLLVLAATRIPCQQQHTSGTYTRTAAAPEMRQAQGPRSPST